MPSVPFSMCGNAEESEKKNLSERGNKNNFINIFT